MNPSHISPIRHTPCPSTPSRTTILNWIRQTLPHQSFFDKFQIQELGSGIIYCKIIHSYYSMSIKLNKIVQNAKNQYEFINNLKLLQNALSLVGIQINFDINKICKKKFQENWLLVNLLYKSLEGDKNKEKLKQKNMNMNMIRENYYNNDDGVNSCSNFTNNNSKVSHRNSQNLRYSRVSTPKKRSFNQRYLSSQKGDQKQKQLQSQQYNNQKHHEKNYLQNSSHYYHQEAIQNNRQILQYHNFKQTNPFFSCFSIMGLDNRMIQPEVKQSKNNDFYNTRDGQQEQDNKIINANNNKNASTLPQFRVPIYNSLPIKQQKQPDSHTPCLLLNNLSLLHHNNTLSIIDRVKQILLQSSHDVEKIRRLKMLINVSQQGENDKNLFNFCHVKNQNNQNNQVKCQEDENCGMKVVDNIIQDGSNIEKNQKKFNDLFKSDSSGDQKNQNEEIQRNQYQRMTKKEMKKMKKINKMSQVKE